MSAKNQPQKILFQDKDVKITNKFVYIKWYYFPWAGSKKISYKDIKKVQKKQLGYAKYRLWGMDASQWGYWLPGDIKRMKREFFIGITIDSSIKPSFTTENVDTAYKILKQQVTQKKQNTESLPEINSSEKQEEKQQEKQQEKIQLKEISK